ncbi:hypothetical protein ABW19_dt0200618 [Dactylella cylindrospora]|nr:hypothetical protein ABW19_dt0200618 [Dactylella cylindrospora]
MASGRQPSSPHSCLLDNSRLFAEALPVWIPSYETGSTNIRYRNLDMEDFEIDWPVLDGCDDDIDVDPYQNPCSLNTYNRKTKVLYNKSHRSTSSTPAPITSYALPGSRPFLNTSSKQVIPLKVDTKMGPARSRSMPPAPLVLSMSAFKSYPLAVPPAPPPSPNLTPPPTPPFCPEYEEHSTLGAYNIPAIAPSRSNRTSGISHISNDKTMGILTLKYCPSDSETDFEDDRDADSGNSGYFTDSFSGDDDDAAPPPPPIQLQRTTSQTPERPAVPRRASSMLNLSKSLPSIPSVQKSSEKMLPSESFFEWDAEPEAPVVHTTQWTKFKSSRHRNRRRDSDSDESHSSKNSVREKAERLRKKLEGVFCKSR